MLRLTTPAAPPIREIVSVEARTARIDYKAKAATFGVASLDADGGLVSLDVVTVRDAEFDEMSAAGFSADAVEAHAATEVAAKSGPVTP